MTKRRKILKIVLDFEDGEVVPDLQVRVYVDSVIGEFKQSEDDLTVTIGSELILVAFRCAVRDGFLPAKDVEVVSKEKDKIKILENGSLSEFPREMGVLASLFRGY